MPDTYELEAETLRTLLAYPVVMPSVKRIAGRIKHVLQRLWAWLMGQVEDDDDDSFDTERRSW